MIDDGLQRIGIDTTPLHRVRWTKWILALAAIGLAGWMGLTAPRLYVMGRTGFEFLFMMILLVIGAVLIFYRLEFGVLAIVASSFFIRFTFSTGSQSAVPISLLVSGFVVAVWVLSMLARRKLQLAPGKYVAPTLLFILLCLLSVPYSWLMLRPDLFGNGGTGRSGMSFTFVQLGGLALMILLPAVMLMTANVLKKEIWFKILFWIVVAVAIPELLSRLGILRLSFAGIALNTGASYALWVVAFTVGQALFNTSFPKPLRAALVAIATIWIYYGAEMGATWFSGWMPAAIALMFLVFMRSRALFFVLLILGLAVFSTRIDHYVQNIWNDAVHYDANRFEIWQIIIFDLTLTKTNFLFGAGPVGYLPFYETYYPGNAWVSHNNYVDIFAEVGLVGFAIFLWMQYGIFRSGWDQRRVMPTPFLTAFNYSVLGGFIGTLFAMGLGDWHIPFVYNIGIPGFDVAVYGWLLLGAMLALRSFRTNTAPTDAHA